MYQLSDLLLIFLSPIERILCHFRSVGTLNIFRNPKKMSQDEIKIIFHLNTLITVLILANTYWNIFSILSAADSLSSFDRFSTGTWAPLVNFFMWKFILTFLLAGIDINNAGGWSLWRPFSYNLRYSELFLQFWPRMREKLEIGFEDFLQDRKMFFKKNLIKKRGEKLNQG